MAFDPTASAAKWASRLTASATDGTFDRGVAGVTISPGVAAARQADVWATNVVAAKPQWQKNVQIPLSEWQAAMTDKAKARLSSLPTGSETKVVAFLTKLAPVVDRAKSQLPARGNFATNKQRATMMMDALHAAKGSFK